MAEPFDLIVIGTGAGGSAAAYECKSKGWRVAVVDELPYGGTCALRGCDPKKVLVSAAQLVDWSRRMQGRGVDGKTQIAWPDHDTCGRATYPCITPHTTDRGRIG